ncbi:MAG: VWA domain-containing protein [Planctomycetota bacterium]|nr:MAG: VWA domain-containing protein [Planctomycetota bacterium]
MPVCSGTGPPDPPSHTRFMSVNLLLVVTAVLSNPLPGSLLRQEPQVSQQDLDLASRVETVQALITDHATAPPLGAALMALGNLQTPEAAQALLDFLPQLSGIPRMVAIEAMAMTKTPDGSEMVRKIYSTSKKQPDRLAAVRGLARLAGKELEYLAGRIKREKDSVVRAQILRELIQQQAPDLEKEILKAAAAKDQHLRMAGLFGIREFVLSKGAKIAIKALKDPNLMVRMEAVSAVSKVGDLKGYKALLEALDETRNEQLGAHIVLALREAQSKGEVEALLRFGLKARDHRVFLASLQALVIAAQHQPLITGPAFLGLLDHTDLEVIQLVIRGLVRARPEGYLALLGDRIEHENTDVQRNAIRALADLGQVPADAKNGLLQQSYSEKSSIRLHTLRALAFLSGNKATERLIAGLQDSSWAVRAAAVEAMTMRRDPDCIEPLLQQMDLEEGRVRSDIASALARLTGRDLGEQIAPWKHWLSLQAKPLTLPTMAQAEAMLAKAAAEKDLGYGGYHGIPVPKGGVVFIVDTSGSMNERHKPEKAESHYEFFSKMLSRTLEKLPEDAEFSILLFDDVARPWSRKLQKATPEAKENATAWLRRVNAFGGTNIYDALRTALRMKGVQTIFLLTDGEPSVGLTSVPEILREVERINLERRIRIHTIAAGQAHAGFLAELAESNGGRSVDLRDL